MFNDTHIIVALCSSDTTDKPFDNLVIPANTNAPISDSCTEENDANLAKLLELFAENSKVNRSHYLPRASALDKLSQDDREVLLNSRRRRLEEEVCHHVLTTCVGRRHFLKSARARMRRLERLAHSYGFWLPEDINRAA